MRLRYSNSSLDDVTAWTKWLNDSMVMHRMSYSPSERCCRMMVGVVVVASDSMLTFSNLGRIKQSKTIFFNNK